MPKPKAPLIKILPHPEGLWGFTILDNPILMNRLLDHHFGLHGDRLRGLPKRCTKCKDLKSLNNFHKHHTTHDGHHTICIKCRRAQAVRDLYKVNPRERIVKLLGNRCCRCGFSDVRALQIDHVNGGGTRDRARLKGAIAYYIHIERNLNSGLYQLLCANCNWIKRVENGEHLTRTGRLAGPGK